MSSKINDSHWILNDNQKRNNDQIGVIKFAIKLTTLVQCQSNIYVIVKYKHNYGIVKRSSFSSTITKVWYNLDCILTKYHKMNILLLTFVRQYIFRNWLVKIISYKIISNLYLQYSLNIFFHLFYYTTCLYKLTK